MKPLIKYQFPLILLLIFGADSGPAAAQSLPPIVDRDSSAVVLAHEETVSGFGSTWELDFYRNLAYDCGLSGKYTFLGMEPANNPNGGEVNGLQATMAAVDYTVANYLPPLPLLSFPVFTLLLLGLLVLGTCTALRREVEQEIP